MLVRYTSTANQDRRIYEMYAEVGPTEVSRLAKDMAEQYVKSEMDQLVFTNWSSEIHGAVLRLINEWDRKFRFVEELDEDNQVVRRSLVRQKG